MHGLLYLYGVVILATFVAIRRNDRCLTMLYARL